MHPLYFEKKCVGVATGCLFRFLPVFNQQSTINNQQS